MSEAPSKNDDQVSEADPGVKAYLAYMNGELAERPEASGEEMRLARLLWGKGVVDKDRPAAEERAAKVFANFRSLIMAERWIALLINSTEEDAFYEDLKDARRRLNSAIRTIIEWRFCEVEVPESIIQRVREATDTLNWLQPENNQEV